MNNINEIVLKNFNANITYLEHSHPKLFEKLSALDSAVANGHYKERYELVYEGEGFDVLEKASGNYLYNKKIKTHAKLSAKALNRELDNNTFECFFPQHFTQEMLDTLEEIQNRNLLKAHKSFTAPILFETQNFTTNQLKKLEKFLFFGTGLAEHIFLMEPQINAQSYLIVEDDLELFRLSLFVNDFTLLAKKASLHFAVFENENEFSHTVNAFLKEKFYLNHYIKYFQLLSHSEQKAHQFYLALLNQPDLQFYFNDYMLITTKPFDYFSKHYKVVQNSLNLQQSAFAEKPFLLCASGPSLQKNIEWLEHNAQSYCIVAVSSSLQYLERYNITPHIIIHLDPFDASWNSFKRLESLDFIKDALIVTAASSPQIMLDALPKENIFLYEASTTYQATSLQLSAPCVGSLAYQFLLIAGAKEIYLLGVDFAVDQESGKDHADIHQDTKELELHNALESEEVLKAKESLIEITGNFRPKVLSTPAFFASVDTINRYFAQLKKEFQLVYNLNDGAKINSAVPLHPNDIKEKSPLQNNLLEILRKFFKQHTKEELATQDITRLQAKLKHAKKLKKRVENLKLPQNSETQAKILLEKVIPQDEIRRFELSRVIESYYYYILHFIHFSAVHTQASSKDVAQLYNILQEQTLKLIRFYIESLAQLMESSNAKF